MQRLGLRQLLVVGLLIGCTVPVVGCGGDESGTQVKVDKQKEDAVLKAMGGYMEKQKGKSKAEGKINK